MAQLPLVGQSFVINEASRLHSVIHTHSVGLLWTSDQPDAETSAWQHTTFTRERHLCPRRDSNPQSQQAGCRRPTLLTARPPLFTSLEQFVCLFVFGARAQPPPHWAKASLFMRFLDHTWCTTAGRTPPDEWSARRRDLYLTTHNTHDRHPCPRWDSNPQSRQTSGRRPTT